MAKKTIPTNANQFRKRWQNFRTFIVAAGSEIYEPTNQYELARFTTPQGTGIIYCDGAGSIKPNHWYGGAFEAWEGFVYGKPWRVVKRVNRGRADPQIKALIVRDGDTCFYCREIFTDENAPTREHFVAVTHGGPNHLSNLALACFDCNVAAGNMSVSEKLEYAIRRRAEAVAKPKQEKSNEPDDDRRDYQALERGDCIDQSRAECPKLSV